MSKTNQLKEGIESIKRNCYEIHKVVNFKTDEIILCANCEFQILGLNKGYLLSRQDALKEELEFLEKTFPIKIECAKCEEILGIVPIEITGRISQIKEELK